MRTIVCILPDIFLQPVVLVSQVKLCHRVGRGVEAAHQSLNLNIAPNFGRRWTGRYA